ncbi:hypothetical protein M885DRAFT_530771 [Pelagophyceae sp. CCMP2097]|nr:hypothetical protein M885DRAFT_530771 [Pelagophyceae sp. CCMP2097]
MAPHNLVSMVLEIEAPSLTPTMIDFLVSEPFCLALVAYVTEVFPAADDAAGLQTQPRPPSDASSDDGADAAAAVAGADAAATDAPDAPDADVADAVDGANARDHAGVIGERAVTLLVGGDDDGDALLPFLRDSAAAMTAPLFQVFFEHPVVSRRGDDDGRVDRACRVLQRLFRAFPDEVYEAVLRNDLDEAVPNEDAPPADCAEDDENAEAPAAVAPRLLAAMLAHTGRHDVVARTFLEIVAGAGDVARPSAAARWAFVRALARWRLVAVLAARIGAADDGSAPAGASDGGAAVSLFADVLDALCRDANGEVLLQPLAHCGIEVGLARLACDGGAAYQRRLEAARALTCALRVGMAVEADNALFQAGGDSSDDDDDEAPGGDARYGTLSDGEDDGPARRATLWACQAPSGGGPTRVGALRRLLRHRVRPLLAPLCAAASAVNVATRRTAAVPHPGRYASVPFTQLRLELVGIIVGLSAQADPEGDAALDEIPGYFWYDAADWFFETFPETTLYHRLFFELVRAALLSKSETTHALLLAPALRLPQRLVAAVLGADAAEDLERRPAAQETDAADGETAELEVRKPRPPTSNRPHALALCDILRLIVATDDAERAATAAADAADATEAADATTATDWEAAADEAADEKAADEAATAPAPPVALAPPCAIAALLDRHAIWAAAQSELVSAARGNARLAPPPPPEPLYGEQGEPLTCDAEPDVGPGSAYARALGFSDGACGDARREACDDDDSVDFESDDDESADTAVECDDDDDDDWPNDANLAGLMIKTT